MRVDHELNIRQISRMINAGVSIRRNPQAEVLAALSLPPRRITRRETIDDRHGNNDQPAPIEQRRLTVHPIQEHAHGNQAVSQFFLSFLTGEIGATDKIV